MAKFYPRKSGNGYTTTYDAHLSKSKLIEAGFFNKDGTVKEYEAIVKRKKIILEPKKVEKTNE